MIVYHLIRLREWWMGVRRLGMLLVLVLGTGWGMGGCTSPPSVRPLLAVADSTLQAEAAHLEQDADREAQWLAQTRRSLAAGYEADLVAAEDLTVAWVREATQVYVAAREELAQHEARRAATRRRRAENLAAAAQAVRRASEMIEQRDRLWLDVVDLDAWSLLGADERGGDG